MLQNAYLLAKIGADTAENERNFADNLPKIRNYPTGLLPSGPPAVPSGVLKDAFVALRVPSSAPRRAARSRATSVGKIGKITKICKMFNLKFAEFWKFSAGSFSAVSKRNFASEYTFDSIFQGLQDVHTSAPLQAQHFRKTSV